VNYVAQVGNLCPTHAALGAARAPAPDARYGHPALRSLDADFAPPSMASLVSNAGSGARAAPRRFPCRESRPAV